MTKTFLVWCVLGVFGVVGGAQTPAEVSIRKAEAEIAKNPEHAPYYNGLAMAYARNRAGAAARPANRRL